MAKKILIVDDEPDLIKVTSYRLKKMGYNVVAGVTGQEALDLIRSENPDLVLLDLRLPVIDGLEVCRRVKADEKLKNIPIILFTASTDSILENVKEVCADDYLIKPFDQKKLEAVLNKFLSIK
jgi:two-component system alkaline phosphatase synthesis response regulator PhoP